MKHDEKLEKQGNMMKNKETTMKQMMKKRKEKTMKHDEK
jgi:hypothetical protein